MILAKVNISSLFVLRRRSYFEVFWFTHHLFVIFYACLVTHGLGYVTSRVCTHTRRLTAPNMFSIYMYM